MSVRPMQTVRKSWGFSIAYVQTQTIFVLRRNASLGEMLSRRPVTSLDV